MLLVQQVQPEIVVETLVYPLTRASAAKAFTVGCPAVVLVVPGLVQFRAPARPSPEYPAKSQ